jgi:cytochrome c oxidase assembly protein subunit 15
VPSALLWIPGSFLASIALSTLGASAGARRFDPARSPDRNWTNTFARVAVLATFLLLIVGGLVTSKRAGLAVVDWPNSYGYSMFLYPLARMTGGIYYEHAHRLFGTLVGLTTLVLAIHLQRADARPWLRRFALAALVVVIVQGLLGGLRVTGRFTMSQDPAETAPNLLLAVVHGVLAQVFFGMIVAIAVFTSTTWKSGRPAVARGSASTERSLSALLVPLLFVQIVLGAIQRHLAGGLHMHITLGVIVFLFAIAVGARLWGSYRDLPPLPRIGRALVIHVGAQIVFGVLAIVGRGMAEGVSDPPAFSVIARTLHQAVGAALFALGVLAALWTRRLLDPRAAVAREGALETAP